MTENELRILDQDNEIQECRVLLDEANSRVEEKEFLTEEKDAQIMVLEERGVELDNRIECIKKEHEQQGIYHSFSVLTLVTQIFKPLQYSFINTNLDRILVLQRKIVG